MAAPFTTYKLIVLYMLQHSKKDLSNSQISEFILDREYTNYFHLQQAISELVETGLLEMRTISNKSYYTLTGEGTSTLSYFEEELSPEIRTEIENYLKVQGCIPPKRIQSPADYYLTPQGSHQVRCQLLEKGTSLIDLNLTVPNAEAAKAICRSWPKKSQNIYELLMEELL